MKHDVGKLKIYDQLAPSSLDEVWNQKFKGQSPSHVACCCELSGKRTAEARRAVIGWEIHVETKKLPWQETPRGMGVGNQ